MMTKSFNIYKVIENNCSGFPNYIVKYFSTYNYIQMEVTKESRERERPNEKYESSKILPRKEENKLSNERECQ